MSEPFKGRPRVFRDPIHGDLAFPERLWRQITALTDTPAFQRLRHIRQNGVTNFSGPSGPRMNLVFHGAEHSRFSHSLGVAWTASRMLTAIQRNSGIALSDEEHDDTVLAALLHDVGHGPFSHALEEILTELECKFDHEHMTVRLIRDPEGLHDILEGTSHGRSNRLVEFIDKSTRHSPSWRYDIVSSQLDADRLDYVRRDAAMMGIDNHRPDIGRLIDNLGACEETIVVHPRAIDVVESFLLALDHMYDAIYYHKSVRAATVVLRETLKRAAHMIESTIPDSEDPLRSILDQGQDVAIGQYIRAMDTTVWVHLERWQKFPDATLSYLATALMQRKFPSVFDCTALPKNDFDKLHGQACTMIRERFPELVVEHAVTRDSVSRVTYRGDDKYPPIMTFREGATMTIQKSPRSIVSKVEQRLVKTRLFVPREISEALSLFARKEGILV